jgi:hypothetical protein
MVGEAPYRPEDRSLERERSNHLRNGDLAMLRLGRLLLIDKSPDLLEDLLADESGEEAGAYTYGNEEELHFQVLARGEGSETPWAPPVIRGRNVIGAVRGGTEQHRDRDERRQRATALARWRPAAAFRPCAAGS